MLEADGMEPAQCRPFPILSCILSPIQNPLCSRAPPPTASGPWCTGGAPSLVAVGGSQRRWGRQGWEGKGQTGGDFRDPVVPSATPSAHPPNIACFALPSPRVIWTWCLIEIEDLFSCVPTQSDLKCGQPQSMLWCFTGPGI